MWAVAQCALTGNQKGHMQICCLNLKACQQMGGLGGGHWLRGALAAHNAMGGINGVIGDCCSACWGGLAAPAAHGPPKTHGIVFRVSDGPFSNLGPD